MARKAHRKQVAYKAFCRNQVVKEGLINKADGTWGRADMGKAMDRDCRAGYKAR